MFHGLRDCDEVLELVGSRCVIWVFMLVPTYSCVSVCMGVECVWVCHRGLSIAVSNEAYEILNIHVKFWTKGLVVHIDYVNQ